MLVPPVVVGEGSEKPPEPQPTPSTAPPETKANIEQILPSPSVYQRKHRKTQKHKRSKKVTELPQTSMPLDLRGDEVIHKEEGIDTSGSPRRQETMGGAPAQTRMEHTFELMDILPPTPHDSPLPRGYTPGSDEDRLKLEELMKRVKKLERQRKSSISHPKRRTYMQVESSDDDLDKEDASKQGRTSDKTKPMFKDSDFNDLDDLVDEGMAFVQEKDADNTKAVNTAGEGVSTAAPRTPPTTTTVFDDKDVTIAMDQTLIKMKEEKAKEKGVAIKDIEDFSRPIRSITTLQPLLTINPKDKGKGILQETEPMEKIKKKVQGDAQIERDAEIALRLQEKLDEELRVERERQEEASKVAITDMFDEVHARIDAEYELAARMTQEEQEKYTIEERAMLLA
ncbi:hypothetical protein Tco_0481438 [Tanacetum coccineum]